MIKQFKKWWVLTIIRYMMFRAVPDSVTFVLKISTALRAYILKWHLSTDLKHGVLDIALPACLSKEHESENVSSHDTKHYTHQIG